MINKSDIKSILIVRFSSLGDLILLTSLVEKLAETYPDASIDILLYKSFKDVFIGNPRIRNILYVKREDKKVRGVFDTSGKESNKKTASEVWNSRYNMILDAHKKNRLHLLKSFIKNSDLTLKINLETVRRHSLVKNLQGRMLSKFVHESPSSALERYNNIIPPGHLLNSDILPTAIYPGEEDRKSAKELCPEERFLILCPGASSRAKQWPTKNFLNLCSLLKSHFSLIIITEKYEEDFELFQSKNNNVSYIYDRKIGFLSALMEASELVIANDSSMTHLAEASGANVLCIFGATIPEFGFAPYRTSSSYIQSPLKLACRPCSSTGSKNCNLSGENHYLCLSSVKTETVFQKIMEMTEADK